MRKWVVNSLLSRVSFAKSLGGPTSEAHPIRGLRINGLAGWPSSIHISSAKKRREERTPPEFGMHQACDTRQHSSVSVGESHRHLAVITLARCLFAMHGSILRCRKPQHESRLLTERLHAIGPSDGPGHGASILSQDTGTDKSILLDSSSG